MVRETDQLRLRPPESCDQLAYESLFQRPEVGRWLRPAPLPAFTPAEAREMLHADIGHWNQLGYGPWAVSERDGEHFLGRVGLHRTTVEGVPETELAWTTEPACQGRGVATEAARAALELAGQAGLEQVVAMALPDNAASRRVAEKIGMGEAGEISHAGLPHVLYRLTLS